MSTLVEPTKVGRRRRWLTGVAGIAAIGALVTVGWIWRHPTAFPEAGGLTVSFRDVPLNAPIYVGVATEDVDASGTITIHSARAHVVSDTAGARIEFFVCSLAGPGGIGAVHQSEINQFCSSLVPAAGARFELNAEPRRQLLMAVSLTNAGRAQFDGVDLKYTRGWQRGTQRIGDEIKLRTRNADGG